MFCGCGTQYLGGNRIERWEKDLNYLQEALPNKHVNAFFKIREDDFNNKIEEHKYGEMLLKKFLEIVDEHNK